MDNRKPNQSLICKIHVIECILTIRTYQVSKAYASDTPKYLSMPMHISYDTYSRVA